MSTSAKIFKNWKYFLRIIGAATYFITGNCGYNTQPINFHLGCSEQWPSKGMECAIKVYTLHSKATGYISPLNLKQRHSYSMLRAKSLSKLFDTDKVSLPTMGRFPSSVTLGLLSVIFSDWRESTLRNRQFMLHTFFTIVGLSDIFYNTNVCYPLIPGRSIKSVTLNCKILF